MVRIGDFQSPDTGSMPVGATNCGCRITASLHWIAIPETGVRLPLSAQVLNGPEANGRIPILHIGFQERVRLPLCPQENKYAGIV